MACTRDEDPYVRKTAALCIAKIYEMNPKKVDEYNFFERLTEMLSDGNGMVVSNAVAAISDISVTRGKFI